MNEKSFGTLRTRRLLILFLGLAMALVAVIAIAPGTAQAADKTDATKPPVTVDQPKAGAPNTATGDTANGGAANNGADANGATGTGNVGMKPMNIPVSRISLVADKDTVNQGNAIKLTAKIEPEDATSKKVTWSVTKGNESVALYVDEACKTPVGSDAIDELTVYAKGVKAGSATVQVVSASERRTATLDISVQESHSVKTSVDPTAGGAATADPETAFAGDVVTIKATPKDGYEFDKWTTENDIKIEDATKAETSFTMIDFDVAVVAHFKEKSTPKTCTIAFDANGGEGTMKPVSDEVGKTVTLATNEFKRANYTFTGWNTAKDGTGTAYADKASVKLEKDITLYAQWKANPAPAPVTKYTLTFDANGGQGTMNSVTDEAGKTVILAANTFTRAGYGFTGWNTAKDGTGTPFADKASVKLDKNITLYAQWRKIVTNPPSVNTSAGGKIVSANSDVTFTIKQDVPWDATTMRIWFDLNNVMRYVTSADKVSVKTSDGTVISNAKVTIDGQRLTVLVEDATGLQEKTVVVAFAARVKDGANLNPYANSAKTMAEIPYQAFTEFNGIENRTVQSSVEKLKVSLPKSTSKSTSKSSSKSSMPKTGDPLTTAFAGVLMAVAFSGAALVFARRRDR